MAAPDAGVVDPELDSDVVWVADSGAADSGITSGANSEVGAEPVDRPPNPAPVTIVPAVEFAATSTSGSAGNLYIRHQLSGSGSVEGMCGRVWSRRRVGSVGAEVSIFVAGASVVIAGASAFVAVASVAVAEVLDSGPSSLSLLGLELGLPLIRS